MGLRNYYFNNIDARLSDSDYWDLYLSSDETYNDPCNGIISGDSLVAFFDFNNSAVFNTANTSIISLIAWTGATTPSSGLTLYDIGLTSIDNGLITYNKPSGDTSNLTLLSALTGNTISFSSADTKFWMHEVTGMTNSYIYPIETQTEPVIGDYKQFCGGFYQGFYKLHGYDYQTLPNRMHKGWVTEFWLKKQDICSGYTGTTLNDDFPNNKGFFYFVGTRSENKFWDQFEGNNTGSTLLCTSGCTEWCTEPKEIDMTTSSGIPLDPPKIFIRDINNKFLLYNRASTAPNCSSGCGTGDSDGLPHGLTPCNFTADSLTISSTTVYTDSENQFLVYNRSVGNHNCGCGDGGHTGFTACNYTGRTTEINPLNWSGDVVSNALGFRIKDDGSIGYRKLNYTCSTGHTSAITMDEGYSISGTVKDDVWTHVAVRFVADITYDECQLIKDGPRIGKLMFYINGKLKYVKKDFIEVVPRALDEHKEKQQTVPYNLSIGGGSQGLIESQTFDGPDSNDSNLLIEENFAGTFIGGISQFRYYDDKLSWCAIKHNYEQEAGYYGHNVNSPCDCMTNTIGIFYGKINNSVFSLVDLDQLTHYSANRNDLDNIINLYVQLPSTYGYGYLLIPEYFTQPNDFYNSQTICGSPAFNIGYTLLPNVTIKGVSYKVYRTFYATHSVVDVKICG